jgi:uncharacterized protein
MIKRVFWALLAGSIFGVGLVLGGMTQTAKVLGFLDVGGIAKGITSTAEKGLWDPSLAFVMGGALLLSLLAFALTPRRAKPWADVKFHLPKGDDIDRPLVVGSALFGVGWGLAGYCPGPALASLLSGSTDVLLFVMAMVAGMWLAKRVGPNRKLG